MKRAISEMSVTWLRDSGCQLGAQLTPWRFPVAFPSSWGQRVLCSCPCWLLLLCWRRLNLPGLGCKELAEQLLFLLL